MSDISKIDSNFKVETKIERNGLRFYDAESKPFKIHGIHREGEIFLRMPGEISKTVSEGVHFLNQHTSGGRVRFVTESPYIAIYALYAEVCRQPHLPMSGGTGFDLYADGIYCGTFIPPLDMDDRYESVIDLGEKKKRVITVNFPYFSQIKKLFIGLDENSATEKAPEYKIAKPVVFYGSSITHGACASKPGSMYQSILERRFDFDYINLGFSGSAKAENEIAEYISNLSMSLFVYDYDHNAPTPEYLRETHEKMFLHIRKKQPELPIIMLSRPRYIQNEDTLARLEIIRNTYENALARGDKNVYFISGRELMGLVRDNGTVDNCHPTDSGFWNMAKRLGDEIEANYDRIFK